MYLGTVILAGFAPFLLVRPLLRKRLVVNAEARHQGRRSLLLDFSLCCGAGIVITIYTSIVLATPLSSIASVLFGCIIGGFFIGLDSSLGDERLLIEKATREGLQLPLPQRYYPMTRKFTLVAILTTIFVAIVLTLVFTRDVIWLSQTSLDRASITHAQLSVTYEIIFIMGVLLALVINLIVAYSRNLSLLFNNQTRVLEQVLHGDLSIQVPVATNDEFGVIAGHTNKMIAGLRHRFELLTSLKMAEEVQQNLLPDHSPLFPGYEIAGNSMYCDETGGDYYDYFQLPGDRLGIVVADACGHGIGAAMLMTSVRAFLTSAIADYRDPAQLLSKVNGYIVRDCAKSGRFTTMFFVEIDNNKNTLRWVRAGHDPAIVYHHQEDRFSRLAGPGLVLGIDDSYPFTNNVIDGLLPGDLLLIGTDGIHETSNRNGELFGIPRVEQLLRHHATKSARTIRNLIVDAVEEFAGNAPRQDDLTLVVIKGVARQ